ncbi:hypothetical protein [Streptomyces sp. NPDC056061]|uniref:hypothetical protein n=1 Tax=Streptomyces sp. NPDC056061 TaxID=3345700 RepID=UPI0035D65572
MKLLSRALVAGVVAGAAALALTGVAHGKEEAVSAPPVQAAAAESPGSVVEDFAYPDADKILQERDIVLKRGDGHILLADCVSGAGLLEVQARDREKFCLKVTGNGGYLSLEVPAVYAVVGNDYSTEVDMTVDGEEKSYQITKNSWTPVGETADPTKRRHTLLEIRAVK